MNKFLFIIALLGISHIGFAQNNTLRISLPEVVEMARSSSYNVKAAEKQLAKQNLMYRQFKVNLKPTLFFNGILPSFTNGTRFFNFGEPVKVRTLQNSGALEYQQALPFTGGNFSVSSSLIRYDFLLDSEKSWQFNPINFSFNQPIFAFNPHKWNKKIEPLKVQVAEREFVEEQEAAGLTAAGLFFDIYIGQTSLEAARIDKLNADTLYRLAQGRFDVGKIAENELLQMELSAQQAEVDIASTTLELQANSDRLRNFLGLGKSVDFDLVQPDEVPEFSVAPEKALAQALKNRKAALDFQHREMQADMVVDQARINPGFKIGLNARVGLSSSEETLAIAASRLLDDENISLSVVVPIYDFGKHKANREMAVLDREIVGLAIGQEKKDFEQEILLKVKQFDLVRNQTKLAERSYEIAQKRYDITRKRYLIGKIGVTDLNIALNEQTSARQGYLRSLRSFWNAYYELRRITLYDFEKDTPLIFD